MKYGFVKLKNEDGTNIYMEVREYERYEEYEVFKSHAKELVVYENIYIGGFPLMFKEEEIKKYNEDAKIKDEISLKDIAFKNNKISTIAQSLGCVN